MEISLFVDTIFASYLPEGSISLIYYANRFMGIPLGVFAVTLSTILLPHFSRISTYAPKRLNFYLLESAKLVFWVTIPCTLVTILLADKIFITLFLSNSFSAAQAHEAGSILIAFMIGLFFFAFNKILLNVFYALHETKVPTIISIIATVINIGLNIVLINPLRGMGLALATTLAGIIQTFLLLYFLRTRFGFHGYIHQWGVFLVRYGMQLSIVVVGFLALYAGITGSIQTWLPAPIAQFFLNKIGFWLWVGPLCLIAGLVLYFYRRLFGVRLYFLD
jgi:putative peptidoglycan lipid II flippase